MPAHSSCRSGSHKSAPVLSIVPTPAGPPAPVDHLDASGPIHPDDLSGRWPILDPFDAIDALDLACPSDFITGVLVLILNKQREPVLSLAVRNAPPDELDPIVSLLLDSRSRENLDAVVFGIVRDEPEMPNIAIGTTAELHHWIELAQRLEDHGIELLDVLTLETSCWSSLALTVGEISYPEETSPRSRWHETYFIDELLHSWPPSDETDGPSID